MTQERTNRIKALTSIAEKYHISAIYAFGSRASEVMAWTNGETVDIEPIESDVDIGVLLRHKAGLSVQEKVQITIEMEDLLGVPRVDLVIISEADPFLALDIIKGELIFCNELDAQAEYELYNRYKKICTHKNTPSTVYSFIVKPS